MAFKLQTTSLQRNMGKIATRTSFYYNSTSGIIKATKKVNELKKKKKKKKKFK